MSVALKLPFGLKDGKLVDIKDVPQGLDCCCVCPACGVRLVAKKGNTKIHHFAHYNSQECQWAIETALHLMAKELIAETKKLVVPPVYLNFNEHNLVKAFDWQELAIDTVQCEQHISNMVPDIVCEAKGNKLFIEIAVTHYIDAVKLAKIRKSGVSTIEINLGDAERGLSKELLKDILFTNSSLKTWAYNVKGDKIVSEILSIAKAKILVHKNYFSRTVESCPRKADHTTADFSRECLCCNYCVDPSIPLCIGDSKDKLIAIAKRHGLVNYKEALIEPEGHILKRYICYSCGYMFDPFNIRPKVSPSTKKQIDAKCDSPGNTSAEVCHEKYFQNLPKEWVCPYCSAGKERFKKTEI